jgi:DNA replication and repair protein RecF
VRLARIELHGFRSWDELDLALPGDRIALVGANATGKTSIVEAAWFAATLSSHRAPDAALVAHLRDDAVIRAHIEREGRAQIVELEIRTKGVARARIGGAPVRRRREVLGVLRAALFAPERVAVVRGDPAERRRFVDELVIQLTPRLYGVVRDYERALRQRNALLREAGGREPPGLDVWDAAIAAPGGELCAARAAAVRSLEPRLRRAWDAVAGEGAVDVAYAPNVPPPEDETSAEAWSASMLARLEERHRDEVSRGITLVGPHRDDVALTVDGLPARTHASQGEAWLVALALVLGSRDVIAERTGEEPVLLLDDALEPLDPRRRERVADVLPRHGQTIVTSADPRGVPKSLGATTFEVERGSVRAIP